MEGVKHTGFKLGTLLTSMPLGFETIMKNFRYNFLLNDTVPYASILFVLVHLAI